jgi:type II secretory pathway pseudopilin PulG
MLVLVISIILAAILLSLIMLTTNRRRLVQRDTLRLELRRNLSSGLAYAQASTTHPYFRRLSLDLFGQETDSVTIEQKPWGVFDVAVVIAAKGQFRDTAVALLGSQFSTENQAALYLADENVPLSVNGDAQVRGVAYLPRAGTARPANLPQTGPARTGLAVTGDVRPSQATLPLEPDSTLARLRDYASLKLTAWLPPGTPITSTVRGQHRSFVASPVLIYQAAPLTLRSVTLTGQVVVASAQRLTVEASAQLDNVLLLAPVVVLKRGFRGRVQVFARDTVDVEEGCQLAYPSAVGAYSAEGPAVVRLGAGSQISGVVLAASTAMARNGKLLMAPSAAIEGQVLATGALENCGVVRGTVMCRHLTYRTAESFYDNYLVNGTVDREGLPKAFLSTPLLNARASRGVAAWLR